MAEPESLYNAMPMVTCPACEKEFQWDDYYDIDVDSERECPRCYATLVCTNREAVMYCDFKVRSGAPEGTKP